MNFRNTLPVLLLAIFLSIPLSAQDRLPTHLQQVATIPSQAGSFGKVIENVNDIDNDGYEDYAVAAENYVTSAGAVGRVFVYSGRNASLIQTFDGIQNTASFGEAIQEIGDINGDGFRDVLVGAPKYDDPTHGGDIGRIACFSGATGAEIWAIVGEIGSGGRLGTSLGVISTGSLTGASAIVAGQPNYTDTFLKQGRIAYYSPVDGSLISFEKGTTGLDSIGKSIATRDGVSGIFSGSEGGRVWQLNGPGSMDPPTLFIGPQAGGRFFPELAILKGPTQGTSGLIVGRRLHSSGGLIANGRVEYIPFGVGPGLVFQGTFQNERFGRRVVAVRDLDGDGVEEIGFASTSIAGINVNVIRFRTFTTAGIMIDDFDSAGAGGADFSSLKDVTGDDRGEIIEGISNGGSFIYAAALFSKGHSFSSLVTLSGGINQFIYNIDLGPINNGKTYFQLYGLSGAYPGFIFSPGDPIVPLLPDATTQLVLDLLGSPFYPDAVGILDGMGMAQTNAFVDAATAAIISGFVVNTAAIVFDFASQKVLATSNPVVVVMP